MSPLTAAEAQARLAAEFEKRGWEYEIPVGQALVAAARNSGTGDPGVLAGMVPGDWLVRHSVERPALVAAIESALGGADLAAPRSTTPVVLNFEGNKHYEVNLSGASKIENSKLILGENNQIDVVDGASREDVLVALEALLRAGLGGEWNDAAAAELAGAIDARDDIGVDDVRTLTAEVVAADPPSSGRARELLDKIAVAGLGGALSTGLSAGLGHLLANPPI